MADSTVGHDDFGVTIYVGRITAAIDVRYLIAAAIAILDGHLGVTLDGLIRIAGIRRDIRHVTTAEDASFYQGITLDGQVRGADLAEVMQIHICADVIRSITCQMTA